MAQCGTYSGGTLTNVQTNLTRKYVYAELLLLARADGGNAARLVA